MQFKFKFIVGETAFEIADEAQSVQEFFEKVSFWQELPSQGPNGETDLAFHYRKTPNEGYEYYSLVSKKAGMEFRFGQPKKEAGALFPKGWVKIERGQDHPEEIEQSERSAGNGRQQPPQERPGKDSTRKITSTTFWAYQKAQGIAKVTASEIVESYTKNNVTDWQGAFAALQQAA